MEEMHNLPSLHKAEGELLPHEGHLSRDVTNVVGKHDSRDYQSG